jgi:hypothetical protein
MSGQQVDVLWFEHMGVFSEPIFNFSFVRLTLKQIGTLFGGMLFAYALAIGASQLAGAVVACFALLVTFYKPRVMPLEQYVLAALGFLLAKNQRVVEKKRVAALMGANEFDEGYLRKTKEKEGTTGKGSMRWLFAKRKDITNER